MRRFLTIAIVTLVPPALALAGGAGTSSLHGEYVEARTADVYTGLCFANGEANQVGDLAVLGWIVQEGAY